MKMTSITCWTGWFSDGWLTGTYCYGPAFYRLEKNKFMVSLENLNPLQNAIQLGFSGSESSPESESSPYATSGSVFISLFISGTSIFSVWYSIFATFAGLESDSPGSILISCFFGTASILIEVVVINFFAKNQKYFPRFWYKNILLSLLSSNGEGCWFGFASSGGMHRDENLKIRININSVIIVALFMKWITSSLYW